jgi:hypothetical protein
MVDTMAVTQEISAIEQESKSSCKGYDHVSTLEGQAHHIETYSYIYHTY